MDTGQRPMTREPWPMAHGPPQGLTLGFVPVSFTGKFTDILGLIACKLITLRPIFIHVIILHAR